MSITHGEPGRCVSQLPTLRDTIPAIWKRFNRDIYRGHMLVLYIIMAGPMATRSNTLAHNRGSFVPGLRIRDLLWLQDWTAIWVSSP